MGEQGRVLVDEPDLDGVVETDVDDLSEREGGHRRHGEQDGLAVAKADVGESVADCPAQLHVRPPDMGTICANHRGSTP